MIGRQGDEDVCKRASLVRLESLVIPLLQAAEVSTLAGVLFSYFSLTNVICTA